MEPAKSSQYRQENYYHPNRLTLFQTIDSNSNKNTNHDERYDTQDHNNNNNCFFFTTSAVDTTTTTMMISPTSVTTTATATKKKDGAVFKLARSNHKNNDDDDDSKHLCKNVFYLQTPPPDGLSQHKNKNNNTTTTTTTTTTTMMGLPTSTVLVGLAEPAVPLFCIEEVNDYDDNDGESHTWAYWYMMKHDWQEDNISVISFQRLDCPIRHDDKEDCFFIPLLSLTPDLFRTRLLERIDQLHEQSLQQQQQCQEQPQYYRFHVDHPQLLAHRHHHRRRRCHHHHLDMIHRIVVDCDLSRGAKNAICPLGTTLGLYCMAHGLVITGCGDRIISSTTTTTNTTTSITTSSRFSPNYVSLALEVMNHQLTNHELAQLLKDISNVQDMKVEIGASPGMNELFRTLSCCSVLRLTLLLNHSHDYSRTCDADDADNNNDRHSSLRGNDDDDDEGEYSSSSLSSASRPPPPLFGMLHNLSIALPQQPMWTLQQLKIDFRSLRTTNENAVTLYKEQDALCMLLEAISSSLSFLQTLELSQFKASSAAALLMSLSELISQHSQLQHLILSNCFAVDDLLLNEEDTEQNKKQTQHRYSQQQHVEMFAMAVQSNTTLTELDLDMTFPLDVDEDEFGVNYRRLGHSRHQYTYGQFTETGVQLMSAILTGALQNNETLQRLSLTTHFRDVAFAIAGADGNSSHDSRSVGDDSFYGTSRSRSVLIAQLLQSFIWAIQTASTSLSGLYVTLNDYFENDYDEVVNDDMDTMFGKQYRNQLEAALSKNATLTNLELYPILSNFCSDYGPSWYDSLDVGNKCMDHIKRNRSIAKARSFIHRSSGNNSHDDIIHDQHNHDYYNPLHDHEAESRGQFKNTSTCVPRCIDFDRMCGYSNGCTGRPSIPRYGHWPHALAVFAAQQQQLQEENDCHCLGAKADWNVSSADSSMCCSCSSSSLPNTVTTSQADSNYLLVQHLAVNGVLCSPMAL